MFKMIAMRYSRALYGVAKESDEVEIIKKDMRIVDDTLTKLPELKNYCLKNKTSLKKSRRVVEIAFSKHISSKTKKTFDIMAKNGRISSLPFIAEAFLKVCEENNEGVKVVAEFANEPDSEIISGIKSKLERRIGKISDMNVKINSSILGGFKVKWSNKIIDNSAIGRIRQLSQLLKVG